MPPGAIIFDFNGTLSDDEPILCEIFSDLFAEHGKPLSAKEYFDELAGLSDPEIVRTWLGRDHPDVDAVIDERIERYRAAVADGSSVHQHVREAVRYAAERVPLAICSGAARAEIEPVVEAAGLAECFQAIVSSDDVVHGKPDPEGYLKTLRLLGESRRRARLRGHRGRHRVGEERRAARDREARDARPRAAARGRRARRPHRRRAHAPMLVIAHRGASAELPENTLPAFERAIEIGADYVELDVHADAQGRLVVTHEPPRARRDYPTLEEALDLMRGRIGVMVELKTPSRYRRHNVVARTVRLLSDADALVCFQRAPLEEARALRPGLRTVQHVGVSVSIRAAHAAWGAGFKDSRVSARGIRAAQRLGLVPLVYTVNDERRMRELAAAGVAGIFTDRPELALRLFRAHPL